jgi:hypothetical protein
MAEGEAVMGEKGEAAADASVERAGERGTVAIEAAADRGGERCVERRTGDGVKEEEGRGGRGSGAATAKCAGALPDGCS